MNLSFVIPTLNEATTLERTLERIQPMAAEIIVSDGGSRDGTVSQARKYTDHVIHCPPGRGGQLDRGARNATGEVLVFVHADTQLPLNADDLIKNIMKDQGVVFGAFRLSIDSTAPFLTGISFVANLRTRFFRLPYGDQAIFVRRSMYLQVGGIRHWPIMEDVDFVRRLNRVGRFAFIPIPVRTSARRWEQERPIFTTLRNWSLMLRYFAGVSPYRLARFYKDKR